MATYISPKAGVKHSEIDRNGVFALEKIYKGEIVFDFSEGKGRIISTEEMNKFCREGKDYGIQIGDDTFFAATEESEMDEGDYLNHSCNPNLGIKDSLKVVAMIDIEVGEELAFDYAMSESSEFNMECRCDQPNCRGTITGEDWKRKDLQEKYKGYFSDYLSCKMNSIIR